MIAPLNLIIAGLVGWSVFGTKEAPQELPSVPPELPGNDGKKKRTRTRKKK